jgi:hypothetical protein
MLEHWPPLLATCQIVSRIPVLLTIEDTSTRKHPVEELAKGVYIASWTHLVRASICEFWCGESPRPNSFVCERKSLTIRDEGDAEVADDGRTICTTK